MLSAKFVIVLLLQALVVSSERQRLLSRIQPRFDARIVGGWPIDITDAPYQVSLQYAGHHGCGGALISDQWILTAAHCTLRIFPYQLSVRLGTAKTSEYGTVVPVRKIVQHKKFSLTNVDYDFSLLQLNEPIQFDETKKAVKLPEPDQVFEDGEPCLVSGWGYTLNWLESRKWLRQVEVPLVNHELCKKKYKLYGGVTDRMICAGFLAGGKDACQGDSGGPMVNKAGVLVGVISWGYGCATPDYPGVYARVASVRNWIKEHSGI